MPTSSEFTWGSYQPPIFQVYGTKRKASGNNTVPDDVSIQNDDLTTHKRRCIWEDSVQGNLATANTAVSNHASFTQDTEIHNNAGTEEMDSTLVKTDQIQESINTLPFAKVLPQLQLVHQVHAQRSPSPRPSPWKVMPPVFPRQQGAPHHNSSNQQTISLQQQQFLQQQQMLQQQEQQQQKTLLQDDYSQICQTEDHIMDLNDEVYDVSAASLAAQQAMDSDFVPNHNQYGSKYSDAMEKMVASPIAEYSSPAMVKCLCRPTWEGYMSTTPYVSDYY